MEVVIKNNIKYMLFIEYFAYIYNWTRSEFNEYIAKSLRFAAIKTNSYTIQYSAVQNNSVQLPS